MHDFFYLQQANTKKMGKIGLSDLRSEVVENIQTLWYMDTKKEFGTRLKTFLAKWNEKSPEYSGYFQRVWLKKYPSNMWTSYFRPKDTLSGNYTLYCFW